MYVAMHKCMHALTYMYTHTCNLYMHIFTGEWSSPKVLNRPPPMGVITFTRINKNKVVIYAGNYDDERSDDLYVFNLDTKVATQICLAMYAMTYEIEIDSY